MKVGIPKECMPDENRVAATPETVGKMLKAGFEVIVEHDAGLKSHISDDDYQAKGATIIEKHDVLLGSADIVLKVQPPMMTAELNEVSYLQDGSTLIAPYLARQTSLLEALTKKRLTAFSLDLLPRIARAQSMDILSSMSNVAGYKSVIIAADYLGKLFPMLTTAAGTITPAKIIIIGAGVAGLQAIATARRLGGVVIAFDTRQAAGEQIKSLGAEFVSLETTHEQAEDAGGYAKEQSADFYKNEQNIIKNYITDADVVICTALIPGKRAPLLITEDMVKSMKSGAVIVDLAAAEKGNCELTEPGKITVKYQVTLVGLLNLPSTMPIDASRLYARNVYSFLDYVSAQLKEGQLNLDDDLIKSCLVTYQGQTRK